MLDSRFSYRNVMRSLLTVLEPVFLWILFCLLAIAFVGTRPYLALAASVAGGIVMALSSFAGFSSLRKEVTEQAGREKRQA